MSDEEFAALPDWHEVENDPEYNRRHIKPPRDAFVLPDNTDEEKDHGRNVSPADFALATNDVDIPNGCSFRSLSLRSSSSNSTLFELTALLKPATAETTPDSFKFYSMMGKRGDSRGADMS